MPESIRFVRIRFSTDLPDGPVRRVFPGPVPVHAFETELAEPGADAEGLTVALVPHSCEREWKPRHDAFLGGAASTVRSPKLRLERTACRAVLIGSAERFADVMAALIEFEHYDSRLRRFEAELDRTEAEAENELPLFFEVRSAEHRTMFAKRMEDYSRLRLEFARLEPRWHDAAPDLSPRAKVWVEKLLERAGTAERSEAVSDRLELREELYEGAADRAADAAGWAHGSKLELTIILLLVVEIGFMATELLLQFRE
ncbi:MAG: hypothetical protein U0791_24675 [Gemmataceae bacterium]